MSPWREKLAKVFNKMFGGEMEQWQTNKAALADWQYAIFLLCWLLNIAALICCFIGLMKADESNKTGISMIPISVLLLGWLSIITGRMFGGFLIKGTVAAGLKELSPEPFTYSLFMLIGFNLIYSSASHWVFLGVIPYCLSWLLLLFALNPWVTSLFQAKDTKSEREWTLWAWCAALLAMFLLVAPAFTETFLGNTESTGYSSRWGPAFMFAWLLVMALGVFLRKQLWPHMLISTIFNSKARSAAANQINSAENGEENAH